MKGVNKTVLFSVLAVCLTTIILVFMTNEESSKDDDLLELLIRMNAVLDNEYADYYKMASFTLMGLDESEVNVLSEVFEKKLNVKGDLEDMEDGHWYGITKDNIHISLYYE